MSYVIKMVFFTVDVSVLILYANLTVVNMDKRNYLCLKTL